MEKIYTIGEASEELGMPASTLRYYDKRGLFPDVARSRGGMRVYTEDDLEWARFIERLNLEKVRPISTEEWMGLNRSRRSSPTGRTTECSLLRVQEPFAAADAETPSQHLFACQCAVDVE